jgi:photosystem II stability/assembly factor-like uncharacterized protein
MQAMRRSIFSRLALGAIAAGAFAVLHAQTPAPSPAATPPPVVNPALFKGLQYRLVGPSRGGRVTAVTGVPSQPRTFYMGVASGGVFRTTDGGANWAPISDGKIPLGSIGAIAVADSDPNVIYVGTGSDGVRSNVSTGRGVYKTTDGGQTWKFAGLYYAGQIGAVRIHPTNPNVVWVSATGDIFKANADRGIFKTTDGGATWKKTLYLSDTLGAMDVELQPGNPDVVYAWMSRLERKPWTIISGGREGGFYKSTNGGDTFTKIATGLPSELIGKANLAVTAANPNRIYALIEAKPGGGMYRSDDAGQTWTATNITTGGLVQRPFYYTTIGADQLNADVVYAGAESFYKSVDAGKTFQSMRTPHGDNHDIWINPKDRNAMIQSNDGGANVSFDGGRTWSSQMNQPTSEIYGVWMDDQFPYKIYGAQQDSSTLIISSAADPFNRDDWRGGPGCETGPIMPHPKNPNVVYGSCKGQYEWMNLETGQSKNYWVGAQSLYGNPASDLILRFQRVSPMATSPHDPEILYYGSQYLHRTRDKGVTWEKISPDLTAHPDCCQGVSGEPITRDVTGEEFFSTLYAITESPLEKGVIWTGSNDGPVYVTRDDGKTWTNVTPKELQPQPGGRVAWIDASPHRRGSAYVAAYRYLLGDYQPLLFRTDDYGKTWTRLTDGKNGIAMDEPTRVVREDPKRPGLLYAGTEFGMYISFDNGGRWQPFQLNMPNVPINDIKIHHNDLVVATQGRAIWVLDNLSAVQQMMPAPAGASAQAGTPGRTPSSDAVYLFRPRDGYRTRVSANLLGPMVEYYLPSVPDGAVTIEILDAKGAVVNTYSSNAPAGGGGRGGRGGGGGGGRAGGGGAGAAAAGGAMTTSMEPPDPEAGGGGGGGRGGGGAVSRVTKEIGINRFVWDVRHQSGLAAPTGLYQVRLKVGDVTQTQPLKVLIDPRLAAEGLTDADLVELFDHNMRMRELSNAVSQTVARVRAARTQLASATGADAEKAKRVNAIYEQLVNTPEGVRYNKPGLQSHVSYLAGMTSGGDQKVGRDALERYQVLKKQLDDIRAELDKLLGPGL